MALSQELLEILACPKCKGDVDFLAADEESDKMVAQANTPVEKDRIASDLAACRSKGDFPQVHPDKVDYMDEVDRMDAAKEFLISAVRNAVTRAFCSTAAASAGIPAAAA